jgi:hypothetical protein
LLTKVPLVAKVVLGAIAVDQSYHGAKQMVTLEEQQSWTEEKVLKGSAELTGSELPGIVLLGTLDPDMAGVRIIRPSSTPLKRVYALLGSRAPKQKYLQEAAAAAQLEGFIGGTMSFSPKVKEVDYIVDTGPNAGRTVDFMLTDMPDVAFDKQWVNIRDEIGRHLQKADIVPIDLRLLSPDP